MFHKMLRPFIINVSVLGYFPLHIYIYYQIGQYLANDLLEIFFNNNIYI